MSTIVGAHKKIGRAARVMALESGAAPSAPTWRPAPARCGGLRQQIVAVLREHPEGVSPKVV